MAVYTVLIGPVDHDGERYEEGAQISLSADDTPDALVSAGVIAEAETPKRKRGEAEG
jgi:hypothetical protein